MSTVFEHLAVEHVREEYERRIPNPGMPEGYEGAMGKGRSRPGHGPTINGKTARLYRRRVYYGPWEDVTEAAE